MNTKMGSQEDRKETIMNIRGLIRKISVMILFAMFLTVAISAGTASDASAHHADGYNDGKGWTWWHVDGVWLGQSYQAVTSTSGYIWVYYGVLENPLIKGGEYDAYYYYYYNFNTGGFLSRIERSTGMTTYPSNCGWISANTTCGYVGGNTTSSAGNTSTAIVGGASNPTDQFTAQLNVILNDIWLVPNCTASYNGC